MSENCGERFSLGDCNASVVDTNTSATIGDLDSNTLYMFAVRAVCTSDNADDSQTSAASNNATAATSELPFN